MAKLAHYLQGENFPRKEMIGVRMYPEGSAISEFPGSPSTSPLLTAVFCLILSSFPVMCAFISLPVMSSGRTGAQRDLVVPLPPGTRWELSSQKCWLNEWNSINHSKRVCKPHSKFHYSSVQACCHLGVQVVKRTNFGDKQVRFDSWLSNSLAEHPNFITSQPQKAHL